jgi:hypothetical protein
MHRLTTAWIRQKLLCKGERYDFFHLMRRWARLNGKGGGGIGGFEEYSGHFANSVVIWVPSPLHSPVRTFSLQIS